MSHTTIQQFAREMSQQLRPTQGRAALREKVQRLMNKSPGCPCDDCSVLRDVLSLLDAEPERPSIDCPLCGVKVEQVASDTLSLALWQHVNWACQKRGAEPESRAQETTTKVCAWCGGNEAECLKTDSGCSRYVMRMRMDDD